MSVDRYVLVGMLGTLTAFSAASCQGPQEFFRNNAISSGTGGAVSTGGQGESTGGVSGTGGTGVTGAGGTGTGGLSATGGSPAIGGQGGSGPGGVAGTGGVATGGVPGTGGRAAGGITGTGGIVAAGGVPGTGGIVATGGVPGTGGAGTAGTAGAAGTTGTAKNCADQIKLAGYSAGTAAPCSACKENGADKSTNCQKVIDCLDTNYPCGSANNCALQCNNSGGADSIVSACVNALLTAATCVQR